MRPCFVVMTTSFSIIFVPPWAPACLDGRIVARTGQKVQQRVILFRDEMEVGDVA